MEAHDGTLLHLSFSCGRETAAGQFIDMPDAGSSSDSEQKVGGEYGEVRASIDVDSLNAYFAEHVMEVKTPVVVKQFKVCYIVLGYICD